MDDKKPTLTEEPEMTQEERVMAPITAVKKKLPRWGMPLLFGIIVVLLFLLFTGPSLVSRTSGGMTPQSIREISQLATLEYRYRDVIVIKEDENFMLFGLLDIDPGEHILIVQYDGMIKLGIDCGKIKFNEYPAKKDGKIRVEIKLPDAELISSETPMDSFEVIVNQGVYTKTTVDIGVFYQEAGKRQEQHNADALNEMGTAARENAKKELQVILESVDDIRDHYEIVWVD